MFERREIQERSACGVGFVASRMAERKHEHLALALEALSCVEHRGGCAADGVTGDGAGIMADIPFEMLGYDPGTVAVATLFVTADPDPRYRAMGAFQDTFKFLGLEVLDYREVPVRMEVLGPQARESAPQILQAIIKRPRACRTDAAFNARLYTAKQITRTKLKERSCWYGLYFISLSTSTIVYKALTRAKDLARFYPDLQDPRFKTRFALFHRRFSTNTRTSWDKAQPFRLIAHNGEINTIAGNRSWAASRERDLGLPRDELLTHDNISDSGSFNEMVEALKHRSSIPHLEDVLAIMMPPAGVSDAMANSNGFYAFWGRAMEPWDGPAFVTFCDGSSIGARLDRNGFRPCRWAMTADTFYLASEAGLFGLDERSILAKGTLQAGTGVTLELHTGELHLDDPSSSRENRGAHFDPRLVPLEVTASDPGPISLEHKQLFGMTQEDLDRLLIPMVAEGKEPIGSMGDTARPAFLSEERRSFFDYFFQSFAQVTNPPLDYLRERTVTDLTTVLGKRPNIFAPTELIPPAPALSLSSPVLTPSELATLRGMNLSRPQHLTQLRVHTLDCVFARANGAAGLATSLDGLASQAAEAVEAGASVLILSHRAASADRPPIPSLLGLRALVVALNRRGIRLDTSIVVDAGDVFTTHHLACLIGFGATAVCPYLAMEVARYEENKALKGLLPQEREENLRHAFEGGLLKIMSKMGISVVQSYQSAKLYAALGLGPKVLERYFAGVECLIGGLELEALAEQILRRTGEPPQTKLPNTYQFKEQSRGREGEKHAMTAARSKIVHELVRGDGPVALRDWRAYEALGREAEPVTIAHLLDLAPKGDPIPSYRVQPVQQITRRFVSGAMSFGAISAESQRDIFLAMKELGGQSNSGEGGENPYYYIDGTTASIKQVASGRFGVTAEYLVSGQQIEIKIAQGAKPGEGGQLMGVKVDAHIARARHARVGVDLISPPPLHDIYSIEDLKQLIYELKQVCPDAPVSVKLVSGVNIGTIAAGVAKAGADIIQVSGGSGGTGAATLTSMKHAGLPWELGLSEVHQTLVEQSLRDHVVLRVDGGLHTARDLVIAALLGAEEFGFGKLLLVAQGCIMARICEKNRCPTGIATHDPKFKAKYKGQAEHVVRTLRVIAEGVREDLALLGATCLDEIVGRRDLLRIHPDHRPRVEALGLDLTRFLQGDRWEPRERRSLFFSGVGELNARLLEDTRPAWEHGQAVEGEYDICSTDRAVLARLSGVLAARSHRLRLESIRAGNGEPDYSPHTLPEGTIRLTFRGSAGQGFGAFMVGGLSVTLEGEANDSVAKSMSGGRLVIRPPKQSPLAPAHNVLIGNCALYGATGGRLYVSGLAGDRFCVRNSGAVAVVEGAGLHACEYMTGGTVVILGAVSANVGAGMTGGTIYLRRQYVDRVNEEYVEATELTPDDVGELSALLRDYAEHTESPTAHEILSKAGEASFVKLLPKGRTQGAAVEEGESEEQPEAVAG